MALLWSAQYGHLTRIIVPGGDDELQGQVGEMPLRDARKSSTLRL
jgi:hypothetical protein